MILYVISVGLSVTMGLMGFINLAHGVFAMAGGFVLSSFMARYGVPFPLALLAAFVLVAAFSVVTKSSMQWTRASGLIALMRAAIACTLALPNSSPSACT